MPRPRPLAALLAAAVLGGTLLVTGLTGGTAAAAGTLLVADRTTGLTDGAAVTLTATGRRPGSALQVLQCRQGDYPKGSVIVAPVDYEGHQLDRWKADCNVFSPDTKIDNSGRTQLGVADTTGTLTVVSYVRKGSMSSVQDDALGQEVPVDLSCDETAPCTLVVIDPHTYKVLQSLPITFATSASAVCGAPTSGTVTGGGPFSLSPTYQHWATASCATGTATPLLADYTDTGEAAGLGDFAAGTSDYAVSALGFTSPGGSDVPNTRNAVFTPLVAQAAVIAFDGNYTLQDKESLLFAGVPITDLSLTMAEVAGLFSSPFGISGAQSPQILARNPQLKKISDPFGLETTLVAPDGVLATPDASVLAMTSAWAALPGSPWTRGALRAFPGNLGNGGADTSSIPLLGNLTALRTRVLGSIFTASADPAHKVFLYLTDSATAAALGLHVAKIENASGVFVAPTEASVAAGVAAMSKGADGVLVPDPSTEDPAAYPLPLVEYAVSPRDAFDPAHQAQLVSFLRYATTTGQRAEDLGAGVFPLSAGLAADASASLALIGTAVRPGPVATTPPPRTPTVPPLAGSVPRTGSLPTAPLPTAVLPGALPAVDGATASPSASPTAPPVAIPAFNAASASALSGWLPPLAVLLLAGLLCSAAYATSGRPVPLRVPAGLGRAGSALRQRVLSRRRA